MLRPETNSKATPWELQILREGQLFAVPAKQKYEREEWNYTSYLDSFARIL